MCSAYKLTEIPASPGCTSAVARVPSSRLDPHNSSFSWAMLAPVQAACVCPLHGRQSSMCACIDLSLLYALLLNNVFACRSGSAGAVSPLPPTVTPWTTSSQVRTCCVTTKAVLHLHLLRCPISCSTLSQPVSRTLVHISVGRPCGLEVIVFYPCMTRMIGCHKLQAPSPCASCDTPACRCVHTEFDEDNDGHLTAVEITHALQSRAVHCTEEQVQEFINGGLPSTLLISDKDVCAAIFVFRTCCAYIALNTSTSLPRLEMFCMDLRPWYLQGGHLSTACMAGTS
jgi:hypothetical protein